VTRKEITGLGEEPSPWWGFVVFAKGTFNLPSCGFQQTNQKRGAPIWHSSRMESWGRKDTEWLNSLELLAWDQLLPPRRKACACSAYLRQEIGKGSQGLAPGKGPGQAFCCHTTELFWSCPPQAPLLWSRTPGRMKQQEGMWSGGCRPKGTACFSTFLGSPWSHQCVPFFLWKVPKDELLFLPS
jgi:hypothetical protein